MGSYDDGLVNGQIANADHMKGVSVPIGGIVPWCKTLTGVPNIPAGFKECDGTAISDADSPMNGQNSPSLNGTNSFLRGSTSSGGTGGATNPSHNHSVPRSGGGGNSGGLRAFSDSSTTAPSIVPSYYDVVYIIRIK